MPFGLCLIAQALLVANYRHMHGGRVNACPGSMLSIFKMVFCMSCGRCEALGTSAVASALLTPQHMPYSTFSWA